MGQLAFSLGTWTFATLFRIEINKTKRADPLTAAGATAGQLRCFLRAWTFPFPLPSLPPPPPLLHCVGYWTKLERIVEGHIHYCGWPLPNQRVCFHSRRGRSTHRYFISLRKLKQFVAANTKQLTRLETADGLARQSRKILDTRGDIPGWIVRVNISWVVETIDLQH